MHQPSHPGCFAPVDHVARAAHVHLLELPVRSPLVYLCRGVEGELALLSSRLDRLRVRDVARHRLRADLRQELAAALAAGEREHHVALADEPPDQPLPDEPRAAGNEHSGHARIVRGTAPLILSRTCSATEHWCKARMALQSRKAAEPLFSG